MASWQSKTIGENPTLKEIANKADIAITAVQGGLEFVKVAGEGAKLLMAAGPEAALALVVKLVGDEVIALLNDYKQIGFYALVIDPFNDNYGAKPQGTYGLDMMTDSDGLIYFKQIQVQNLDSPFNGNIYAVNENYRKSLKLDDLTNFRSYTVGYGASQREDVNYRDRRGRSKEEPGFVPPIPVLVNPPKYVLGGYDPANWTGDLQVFDPHPALPADKVLTLMSEAFDDEGDIPKYRIIDSKETFSKGPFTESGSTISEYDPFADYKMSLYRSANTKLETSKRGEITKQIQSGKPSFEGNTEIDGIGVSALVIVAGAPDINDFLNTIKSLAKFLGGPLPDLTKILKALEKMLLPDPITITMEVNTTFGEFKKGEYIRGFDSGCVGEITEIISSEPTVRTRKEYEFINDEFGDLKEIKTKLIDGNLPVVYKDVKLTYIPKNVLIRNFAPTEMICEAIKYTVTTAEGKEIPRWRIKGSDKKADAPAASATTSAADLPKYGFMKSVDALAPASVQPDFFSVKASQIPGYTEFFDGLISLAEGLIGFAEDALAFIQTLIDAIDDVIEYFEELAAKIIKFLELFKIGLPAAGIYMLAIKTTGGNKAIQAAITGSGNAPPSTLTYSCGVLLVGVEVNGFNPFEEILVKKLLQLEPQSV